MMASHFRAIVILATAVAAGGCANIPQTAATPQSRLSGSPSRPSSGNGRFAELQIDPGQSTDTNSAAQFGKLPGGIVQSTWRDSGLDSGLPLDQLDNEASGRPTGAGFESRGQVGLKPPAPLMPLDRRDNPERPGQPGGPSPGGAASNQNFRSMPTAAGQYLQLAPNETAAERAVLLAQTLEKAQAEAATLRERVRTLDLQIQALERARTDESRVVDQAAGEIARARNQLESLHGEVVALRERLLRLDRQDLDTLREIVSALEKIMHDDSPKKQ